MSDIVDDIDWLRRQEPAVLDAARAVIAENNWAPFILRAVAAGILKGRELVTEDRLTPPEE